MNADNLQWLLAELDTAGFPLEASAIISTNGVVATSTFGSRVDDDRASAISAALFSVAQSVAQYFDRGAFESVTVQGEYGSIWVSPLNDANLIVLLPSADADMETLPAIAIPLIQTIATQTDTGSEPVTTNKQCAMTTYDLVSLLADLSEQVAILIGKKGAISVFRYAGKQMGKRLGSGVQGDAEVARELVATFFQDKAFMDAISLQGNKAELQGCQIGVVLKERGIQAGSHALCNFGFGLIDGVMGSVTGKRIITLHVSSEYHEEGITCHETW